MRANSASAGWANGVPSGDRLSDHGSDSCRCRCRIWTGFACGAIASRTRAVSAAEILEALGADRLDAERHVLQALGASERGNYDFIDTTAGLFRLLCLDDRSAGEERAGDGYAGQEDAGLPGSLTSDLAHFAACHR